MKVKSKEKLISKGNVFAKLERLEDEPGNSCHVVGLLMGVMLISIMTISVMLAH